MTEASTAAAAETETDTVAPVAAVESEAPAAEPVAPAADAEAKHEDRLEQAKDAVVHGVA